MRVVDTEGAYDDSEYAEETCERVADERGGAVEVRGGVKDWVSSLPRYDFADGLSYEAFGVTLDLVGEECVEVTEAGVAFRTPA